MSSVKNFAPVDLLQLFLNEAVGCGLFKNALDVIRTQNAIEAYRSTVADLDLVNENNVRLQLQVAELKAQLAKTPND
jgi:hypothetical protein